MSVTVVVGAQWGDEGKGKIVDVLSPTMDVVARYQGGNNAGHTVVIHGRKYVLHTLPSGILHPGVLNVIGNGVVVDPRALLVEIEDIEREGFPIELGNLLISEQAHLILPQHAALDRARESQLGSGKIGTTGRGIGAAYAAKASRRGLRMCDFRHPDRFARRYREYATFANELLAKFHQADPLNTDEILEELMESGRKLLPYIGDTVAALNDAIDQGKHVLAEGAQGVLLDVDFGTYPYVTSSSPSPGGACTGLGVSPRHIETIIGVSKAYTTRVGAGPFPTELDNDTGEEIRRIGGEFGATTGRPRRCGWFDAPAVRRAIQVSGCTEITLTKLDVLSAFDRIGVCIAYETASGWRQLMPFDVDEIEDAHPQIEYLEGWKCPIGEVRKPADLPPHALRYIEYIQKLVGVPIRMVSVGPDRRQTLVAEKGF